MKQTYIQQHGKFKSNYKMNLFVADQVKHFTWQIIMEQTFNLGRPRLELILNDVSIYVW
jgi:tryptophan-rich sensory protein